MRSVREERLSKIIPLSERHLREVLREYIAHYHAERNHQGLGNRRIAPSNTQGTGDIVRSKRIGGMLNYYYREAACEGVDPRLAQFVDRDLALGSCSENRRVPVVAGDARAGLEAAVHAAQVRERQVCAAQRPKCVRAACSIARATRVPSHSAERNKRARNVLRSCASRVTSAASALARAR